MKNKKNIIIIISIVLIAILAFLVIKIINNNEKIGNITNVTTTKDEKVISAIKSDMKITYVHRMVETGYGTDYDYDLINIKEKKAYLIHDFDIWGKEKDPQKIGHNFTITPITLTDNDITMLENLTKRQSDEELKKSMDKEYVKIEYNGKTICLENVDIQYENK